MDNGAILYKNFLNGDNESLNKIVELYGNSLMLFINTFLNDLSQSEEIMEDVFVELIVKKHKFREESSFKTFLFKIGKNKAFNLLKKNKRISYIEDQEIEDTKKLEDGIIKTDEQRNINRALKQLPKDYKMVLYLIYFEDMSYDEICKVMGKNNKQIKNLAYRARIQLKNILEKEGFKYEDK